MLANMLADMVNAAFINTMAAEFSGRSIVYAEHKNIMDNSVTVSAHGSDEQKKEYARILYTAAPIAKLMVGDPAANKLEFLGLHFRQLCQPLLNDLQSFMPTPAATPTVATHAAAAEDEIPDVMPGSRGP